jgi:parallel beta-helix repeat protein
VNKLILLLAFVILFGTAPAYAVDITVCQDLTAGTAYTLTADIANYAGGRAYCMYALGNGVTLDCNGYKIDGVDAAKPGFYMASGSSHILIKNCTFTDWQQGVYIFGSGSNVTVDNSSFSSNTAVDIYAIANTTNITNTVLSGGVVGITTAGTNNYIYNTTIAGAGYSGRTIELTTNNTVIVLNKVVTDYSKVWLAPLKEIDITITDITSTNAVVLKAVNEYTGARLWFNVSDGINNILTQYTNLTVTSTVSTWTFSSGNGTTYWGKTYIRSPSTGYELKATLIPSTNTINNVNFVVQSNVFTSVPGATVTVYAPYSGYTLMVDTRITDSSGSAYINGLATTTYYLVTTSAAGYNTYSGYIYPTATTAYIPLSQSSAMGFDYPYSDITCNWNIPQSSIVNASTVFTLDITPLNFTVINGTSYPPNLTYCGWYVYNGTALFNASNPTMNVTNITGCQLKVNITPYDVGNITIIGFFQPVGSPNEYHCSRFFYVYYIPEFTQSASNLITKLAVSGGGFGNAFMSLVVIFMALLCGAFVGRANGLLGAGVFILVLGAFYTVGIVTGGLLFALIITALAIAIRRNIW